MNDEPTTDATPDWFTPPDRGAGRSWPAPPKDEPAPDALPALDDLPFVETWLGPTAAEAPAPPAPAPVLASALAPPTPLIRPQLPRAPQPAEPAGPVVTYGTPPPSPSSEDAGPGWRVRDRETGLTTEVPREEAVLPPFPEPPQDVRVQAAVIPAMPWERRTGSRPMRRYILLGVGLFALCGLTAMVLAGVGRSTKSIQQPGSIGAMTQVDTPQVSALLGALARYEQSIGAGSVVTGSYGTSGQPQMLLVVVQGGSVSGGGGTRALDSFMRGLTAGAGGAGWVLDPSKLTTSKADGTNFECDSGPSSNLEGAILSTCAWTDPGIAGAVVDVSGVSLADTLNEAVQARAAAEH